MQGYRAARQSFWTRRMVWLLLIATMALMAGCAGKTGPVEQVFFPPPPNLPRIQYLMGIADSTDVEGKISDFSLFGSLNEQGDKVRAIVKPYGVAEFGGKIYICDVGSAKVIVLDLPAKKFEYLKGAVGNGKLTTPVNVAFDKEGTVYVADAGRKEVLAFTSAGDFLQAFGSELDMKPVDVAVYGSDLFVLDLKNNEIKVLDLKTGKLKESFGRSSNPMESLAMPTNMLMDDKGYIFVTNGMSGKVMKFDRDGHLLLSFGQIGDGFGQFARPKGVTVDRDGDIYVVDAGHQNVQIFNDKGRLLIFFGDAGKDSPASLNLPAGIAISTANLDYFQKLADPTFKLDSVVFVTNQVGDRSKLAVYGFGKREGIDYEKEYEKIRQELQEKARKAREKQEQEAKAKKEQEERQNKGQAVDGQQNVAPAPVGK